MNKLNLFYESSLNYYDLQSQKKSSELLWHFYA
jgi:hypothetical protein